MFVLGGILCVLGLGIGFITFVWGAHHKFEVAVPLVPAALSVALWLLGFILCCLG